MSITALQTGYNVGNFLGETYGLARALDYTGRVLDTGNYLRAGATIAGGIAAVTSPYIGPALAIAGTLYGAKQIYDGATSIF